MAFTKEIEQFEFEFDQEWANVVAENDGADLDTVEWFDLYARSQYVGQVGISLTIEQAREVRDLIDAEIVKYDAWEAKRNG